MKSRWVSTSKKIIFRVHSWLIFFSLNKTFLFFKFPLQSRPALLQPVTITDRVRLRLDQSLVRLGQVGQLSPSAFLRFSQAGERRGDPAVAHHKREQRRAGQISLVRPGDYIAGERAVARGLAQRSCAIRI